MLKSSNSKLNRLKKVSQLDHDHPVKKFIEDRKIPSDKHYLLYYAPHFYKFVNTIIDNKFPSLVNDHPRLVIPFFNEDNDLIAIQGEHLEMKILNTSQSRLTRIKKKYMELIESIGIEQFVYLKFY